MRTQGGSQPHNTRRSSDKDPPLPACQRSTSMVEHNSSRQDYPLIRLHTMMGSFMLIKVLFQSYTSYNQANTMFFTWSICLRRIMALSNSSTMVLRAGLAPAAHWSRWEIRNCWLLILSRTLVSDATVCSWRTWMSEGRMSKRRVRDKHHNNRYKQPAKLLLILSPLAYLHCLYSQMAEELGLCF